jgi:hypothetical protein
MIYKNARTERVYSLEYLDPSLSASLSLLEIPYQPPIPLPPDGFDLQRLKILVPSRCESARRSRLAAEGYGTLWLAVFGVRSLKHRVWMDGWMGERERAEDLVLFLCDLRD